VLKFVKIEKKWDNINFFQNNINVITISQLIKRLSLKYVVKIAFLGL